MVVCKFFLQGECKFGENCKFDHQFPTGNISASGNQQTFQRNQNHVFVAKPANEVDTNTLITSVHNDMVSVEKSGQWLLTCYAPFKEKQLFPGFQDESFEEIRLGFYDAQKTNTFEQYKQQLHQALVNAKTKFKALQTPTKEMVDILRNIYNTQSTTTTNNITNQDSIFDSKQSFGPPSSSIFAQNAPKQIGNQNLGSSLFGPNAGQNSAAQLFGQQNLNQNGAGISGQQNKASTFGQQSANNGSQGLQFGSMRPYVSNYISNVQKIHNGEGYMFYNPYSYEETRYFFFESLRIFENVMQNERLTISGSVQNPFEVEGKNSSHISNEHQKVSSGPFRAKSNYFLQNQYSNDELELPIDRLPLQTSLRPRGIGGINQNENNWLLKYMLDDMKQIRKEHEYLSLKVLFLENENKVFREEIYKLKSISSTEETFKL